MATNTTRLALVKPAAAENYDVSIVNGNSDKVDAAVSRVTCTSTTRPSAPFPGQAIYETDTRNSLTWNGAAWAHETVPVVAATSAIANPYTGQRIILSTDGHHEYRWNGTAWVSPAPRGIVASHFRTTNGGPTSATSRATSLGIIRLDDVPLKAGRLYRVASPNLGVWSDAVNARVEVGFRITTDGSTPTNASPQLTQGSINVGPELSLVTSLTVETLYTPPSDLLFSVLMTIHKTSGAGNVFTFGDSSLWQSRLLIEDVGIPPAAFGTSV